MPKDQRNWYPNKSLYDFKIIMKDKDYSEDLKGLRMFSSIAVPYITFLLDFWLDPMDVIEESLFGENPIKLTIRLVNQDGIPEEITDYELMYVKSDFKMPNKVALASKDQKDFVPVKIIAVPREEFKFASTLVNAIYRNKTPKEVIQDLISRVGANLALYDTDGENTEKISQLIIPPTSLIKAIKFIADKFGLYDGPYNLAFENKKDVKIQNLTARMNKEPAFNIYHIPQNKDSEKRIEKSISGKDFYTFTPLKSNYNLPSRISVIGNDLNYIVKPSDALYYNVKQNVINDSPKYSIIAQNRELPVDGILKGRERYIITTTGYEKTDTFAKMDISKKTSGFAKLELSLEKNFQIENLIKAGECVKLSSGTLEYADLCGRYILQGTDIKFNKDGRLGWASTARVFLIRSNKTLV